MIDVSAVRIRAILIAFETQRKNMERTGSRIKAIWEELSPIEEITSVEMCNRVDELLNEFDQIKPEFDEYMQDLNNFAELVEHEFDLIIEPLEVEIKRIEKLMKDYRDSIKIVNAEINRRYRRG
jgi:archaellum component FlaC